MLKICVFFSHPHPIQNNNKGVGVTWPSSVAPPAAGKAFTLTANNTLLAGLEGPLVKDDPSVRRLMEAPGPGGYRAITPRGWRWRIYFLHEKKRHGNGAIFVRTCCAIDMAGFFKQQIQRKSPILWGRKQSFLKKMDNKKHPKPKVFSLQLLKVLHMSNEKKRSCLRYIGDCTTKLHRDYTKPLNVSPMNQPVWLMSLVASGYASKLRGDTPAPEQVDQTGRLLWSGFMLVDNVPSTPLLLSELATLKLPKDHLGGPRLGWWLGWLVNMWGFEK